MKHMLIEMFYVVVLGATMGFVFAALVIRALSCATPQESVQVERIVLHLRDGKQFVHTLVDPEDLQPGADP